MYVSLDMREFLELKSVTLTIGITSYAIAWFGLTY